MSPLGQMAGGHYPIWQGLIVVYKDSADLNAEYDRIALDTEIHELCHMNQYFHSVEQMRPGRLITIPGVSTSLGAWLTTKPGSSFIDLVGFSQDATGEWSLPDDTTFRNIYGLDNPIELSAELCMLYFIDRMGERYGFENVDPMRYLIDEIVEWIETWVALPEIVEG